jgi:eukaryotic-like serine/threonine-protein kinase
VQERLGLFARTGAILSFGAYGIVNLSLVLFGSHADARALAFMPATALPLGIALLCAVVWLLCRWRLSRRVLHTVDAALVVVVCAIPSSTLLLLGSRLPGQAYMMLLLVTNVLVARSLFVPSRPLRTLWVSLAAMALPLVAASYQPRSTVAASGLGTPFFLIESLAWFACAGATSTLASSLIFGLRQKVREARRLGQYTLEAKLGEGGMGVVYRARHAMLRRPTAVKLLPLEKAGEQSVRRFEREVQLTAQLSHPNTVAIYDYGRTPDGVFYYAMEYLDGIDLERLVRGFGPQPPARVAHVLRQVAGALAEAHGVGLIHRDIKPANIILCRRGGAPDVAKVVDFGLVKDVAGAWDVSVTALNPNTIAGTPLYLSPEAITRPDHVDARSDLYSLGAVGYYLLAGKNVFTGATLVEVCGHHLHTAPEPPSAKLGRPLPARLEALVQSCLEKDPARRPQTAQHVAEALVNCDAGEWSVPEARHWWSRYEGRLETPATTDGREPAGETGLPTLSIDLERRLPPAREA